MTPLTLTYRLSETQFMHAAGVLWAYRAIGDKGNWITVILCLAAGPVLLLNGVATGWLFIAVAAFFFVLTWARRMIWRRAYRRMVKYTGPITAVFEEGQVTTRSEEGENTLPLTHFKSYAETPEYLFLFGPKRALSIIPKSALPTPEDIELLRDFITAVHLPRKKMRWT